MSNWIGECSVEDLPRGPNGLDGFHVAAAPTGAGMRAGGRTNPTPTDLRVEYPGALSKSERETIRKGLESTRVKRPAMEHRDNVVLTLRDAGMTGPEIADAMTKAGEPMTKNAVYLLLRREGKVRHNVEIQKPLCAKAGCKNHSYRPNSPAAGGLCKKCYGELRARVREALVQ